MGTKIQGRSSPYRRNHAPARFPARRTDRHPQKAKTPVPVRIRDQWPLFSEVFQLFSLTFRLTKDVHGTKRLAQAVTAAKIMTADGNTAAPGAPVPSWSKACSASWRTAQTWQPVPLQSWPAFPAIRSTEKNTAAKTTAHNSSALNFCLFVCTFHPPLFRSPAYLLLFPKMKTISIL